jgi:hypothetical protein
MKPLYTQEQFEKANSADLLEVTCICCGTVFTIPKKAITLANKNTSRRKCNYCSPQCAGIAKNTKTKVSCKQCGKEFLKPPCEVSKNNFCNHSCRATYCNTHKSRGYRRSKLEIWLETELTKLYKIEIKYNSIEVINAELDIYIPELKLAFELNGIFHYEPIYGQEKLSKIKSNDSRKMQACLERGIELCIIDTSPLRYFKAEKAKIYLEIIKRIISYKLVGSQGIQSTISPQPSHSLNSA